MAAFDTFKTKLEKKFGGDKIYMASEEPDVDVVSTGSLTLDYALGVGGIPRGRIVEVFGRESVGKTALLYYMIAEHQKAGLNCGFINLEGAFDPEWAQLIAGVDLDKLAVGAPDPGTEAIEMLGMMVESGEFGFIGFDSIGAMLGDKEQDFKNKKQAGGQSALVTHMVKLISAPAARNGTTVVFLNQVRDDFDSMYNVEKSPGGHAAKHMAVIRIHMKPGKDKYKDIVNGEEIVVGFRANARVIKNKASAPNQVASWNFWNYPQPDGTIGIDKDQELIDLVLSTGVVRRAGKFYVHDIFPENSAGKHQIEGKEAVLEFFAENPDALKIVRRELLERSINQREKHLTLV